MTIGLLVIGGPILLLALVWVPIFYLRGSAKRKHRREWRELAKLSGLTYYSHGRAVKRGIQQVPGIDSPNLGSVKQAITGEIGGCWFAVTESMVHRQSIAAALNANAFGKPVRATFCVMVVPQLELPEFCITRKSGQGLTAALNALLDSGVELDEGFSKEYRVRSQSEGSVRSLLDASMQSWFLETTPLNMSVRHQGDVEDMRCQLELHVKNSTLTLVCLSERNLKLFENNYGPLAAKHLQGLIDRLKQIKDVFVSAPASLDV